MHQTRPHLRLAHVLLLTAFGQVSVACSGTSDEPLPSGGNEAASSGVGASNSGDGTTGGTGASSAVGDGDASGDGDGQSVSPPPDCSLISAAGFDLCSDSTTTCEAVFEGGEGCSAVCAAAGLECVGAFENLEGQCAADTGRAGIDCDSGHESDYCVCGGTPTSVRTGGSSSSSGGASSGGASSGGASSGGASSGGSSSGGSPSVGPRACGCENDAGEYGEVSSTIKVGSGQTYDGGCKIFRADPDNLGDGSQEEGQKPIFELEDGATLRNVIIGASGADGIHVKGDVTLENVHWDDVGEDALTVKEEGTVRIDCGSAFKASDKIFQINAPSEFYVSNFTASGAGKMIRQVGGSTFHVDVFIDHCDVSNMSEVIFRTDSSSSHVTLTNTRYRSLDDGFFMFGSSVVNGNSSQSTVSNNQSY